MRTELRVIVPEMVLPPVVSTLTSHGCAGQFGVGAENAPPMPPMPPNWATAVEASSKPAKTGRVTKRDMDDLLLMCGVMDEAPAEVLTVSLHRARRVAPRRDTVTRRRVNFAGKPAVCVRPAGASAASVPR